MLDNAFTCDSSGPTAASGSSENTLSRSQPSLDFVKSPELAASGSYHDGLDRNSDEDATRTRTAPDPVLLPNSRNGPVPVGTSTFPVANSSNSSALFCEQNHQTRQTKEWQTSNPTQITLTTSIPRTTNLIVKNSMCKRVDTLIKHKPGIRPHLM